MSISLNDCLPGTKYGSLTFVQYIASGDGISSLDYNGKAVVTGGIFASSGASGMAQNFDPSSTQGIIMVTLNPQEAGTQIALKNSDGTELLSWKAEKEYASELL